MLGVEHFLVVHSEPHSRHIASRNVALSCNKSRALAVNHLFWLGSTPSVLQIILTCCALCQRVVLIACTYPNLWIRCIPDAVSTGPLTSPFFSLKAASSNSFCMSPCPKKPLQASVASIDSYIPGALTGLLLCEHYCNPTLWLRARIVTSQKASHCLPRTPGFALGNR
jgi:hypothetical protein